MTDQYILFVEAGGSMHRVAREEDHRQIPPLGGRRRFAAAARGRVPARDRGRERGRAAPVSA